MDTATDGQGSEEVAKPCEPRARPSFISFTARFALLAAALLWLLGIAFGIDQFRRFESTPGAAGITPVWWPAASGIQPYSGQSTLVMLVHPQCSCTGASLSELAQIMNQSPGRLSAFVLFVKPSGAGQGWEETATWRQAVRIPGVTVLLDPQGTEAARFGALTSGHAVLYGPDGHLQFSGGITGARGHAGDNMGRESVLAQLTAKTAGSHEHAVFGCPLGDERARVAHP